MNVARVVALRSRCTRSQVGAVIVDSSQRIIATAYNGVASGHPGEGPCDHYCRRSVVGPTTTTIKSYEDCPALHAEANALMVCDRRDRLDGTLYVTGTVCFSCAKLLTNSGLRRIVVPQLDTDYRDPEPSYKLLLSCGLQLSRMP